MDMCGDNRFKVIARAKEHLLDATNIETSEEEMAVLDNFLFRCWQMGWLDKYDEMSDLISRQDALKPFCIAPDGTRIPEVDCDNFPVEFSVEFIKKHLLSLPSVEVIQRW